GSVVVGGLVLPPIMVEQPPSSDATSAISMWVRFSMSIRDQREGEAEVCTGIDAVDQLDLAAMRTHVLAHERESDAGATHVTLARRRARVEGLDASSALAAGHVRPGVGDVEHELAVQPQSAQVHRAALRRVLDGVRDEVA